MKLLIVTQAVDADDSDLGFFVQWIEEFSKHCEKITVICLREGKYTLPSNVEIIVLGKAPRLVRAMRFWRACISRRAEYDAVFVHMNPEYIVLAGLLWRFMHKRIALWYTHKSVNLKLRIAVLFAHTIFSASAESFCLRTKKLRVMGHGIDVDFFSPDPQILRGTAVISVGRLSPTKRHDLTICAAEHFPNEVWVVGEGPEMQRLKNLAEQLSLVSRVHFLGPQTQEQLREKYRTAGVFVHTSETGSLDKVVLEALACGLPVITTSTILTGLPVIVISATPEDIAKEVIAVRTIDTDSLVAYVREHHSLQHLIPIILDSIQVI